MAKAQIMSATYRLGAQKLFKEYGLAGRVITKVKVSCTTTNSL